MFVTVSVIIPAYDSAPYLKQAVDSVLSQVSARFQLEVLVIDDGSADNTEEVSRSYGNSIRYFRIGHCGLPGVVRNHGVQRAQGDFVAFLDADDFLLPGSLETRLRVLLRDSGLGFVFGNFYVLEGDRWTHWFKDDEPQSGLIFEKLFLHNYTLVATSTILIRRSLIREAGGFYPCGQQHEDYWLWLQLAKRARSAYVNEPVSVYRKRPGSLSTAPSIEKLPDLIRVLQSISKEFQVPRPIVLERINPLRLWLAKEFLREGRYWSAVSWLAPAFLSQPKEFLTVAYRHLQKTRTSDAQCER